MKTLILSLMLCVLAFPAFAEGKESAYERVLRTGTLRCAYALTGPYLTKDLNSGVFSGPIVEIVQEMAAGLGLKVEWASEVGYADFAEGFKTGRYDAFCGSLSIVPARARVSKFTRPYFGLIVMAYVRAGETRFYSLEDMNKPDIKAGDTDGEIFQAMTRKMLPLATEVSQPNMGSTAQLFVDLNNKKTDVVFLDTFTELNFEKNNPGQVKAAFDKPIGVFPCGFAVGAHEGDLRDMLDVGLLHLQNIGKIDSILQSYGLDDKMVYRAAPIFDAPDKN